MFFEVAAHEMSMWMYTCAVEVQAFECGAGHGWDPHLAALCSCGYADVQRATR